MKISTLIETLQKHVGICEDPEVFIEDEDGNLLAVDLVTTIETKSNCCVVLYAILAE